MLVIRRRVGETLVIGADIEVEVLESGGSQVKLGIRAPRAIGVVRKEIRTVGEQNQAAAQLVKQFKNPRPKPIRPV
ncbi:MAG: carbon storage regulator [Bryobacteraceae bacterium]